LLSDAIPEEDWNTKSAYALDFADENTTTSVVIWIGVASARSI
jgi:hypothetical protein